MHLFLMKKIINYRIKVGIHGERMRDTVLRESHRNVKDRFHSSFLTIICISYHKQKNNKTCGPLSGTPSYGILTKFTPNIYYKGSLCLLTIFTNN
jgi:hypothetical protein